MKRKIRKILIANRGEIAIRVINTCRGMGIRTVALFSDADGDSPFVRQADESVHLGPASPRESYLNQEKVIAAAKRSGADAIHPGYGFLSENPKFVDAVEHSGLIFIGPSAEAIRQLGDKTSAKAIARKLGVPVVPGTVTSLGSSDEALDVAASIGYPVLLKAAAGGGGKGMRVVREAKDLPAAFNLSKSEALSSFSDDRVYIEKYILNPRHIEVQILADAHGNVVHLGERECSIQRRHQKLIEESPSIAIDDTLRTSLTGSAVTLASNTGYTSAGTVEFILDESGQYYFMEVNTRLQVEHPVTELRTGIDLVREQINIASGERLAVKQDDVRFSGHAIECRICAEDSANNFIPFIGTIGHIAHPSGPGVRVDTGIESGSTITAYYDPMISKVIAFGPTRDEALGTMVSALEQYEIYGVKTNIDLQLWVLTDPDFIAGRFDTNFIGRKYRPELFQAIPVDIAELAGIAATTLHLAEEDRYRASSPGHGASNASGPCTGLGRPSPRTFIAVIGSEQREIREDDVRRSEGAGGPTATIRRSAGGTSVLELSHRGRTRRIMSRSLPDGARECWIGQYRVVVSLEDARYAGLWKFVRAAEHVTDGCSVRAPMPGLVREIAVRTGDRVAKGQRLLTLEAMKMENEISAPMDGIVGKCLLTPGVSVDKGQELIHINLHDTP